MANPELEYNLAGGLLLTIREKDFARLQEQLVESDFNYGCILPFRSLVKDSNLETLKNSPLQIIHFEDAWNPTNQDNLTLAITAGIIGQLKRIVGDKTEPPILQDSLFPSKKTCDSLLKNFVTAFPNAKFISHQIISNYDSEKWLLEINPGIKLEPTEILEEINQSGVGVAFDPRHLLQTETTISLPNQPTKTLKGEWEKQFQFFKDKIEVVDIGGDPKELFKTNGELRELVKAAKETSNIKFLRVEIPIPPLHQLPLIRQSQEKGFSFLQEISQSIKEI